MNTRNQISDLIDFTSKAIKLGKYNTNTGGGILQALRAVEKGFQPDEPKDIDYLGGHMEELFLRQNLSLSPQSLAVYIGRLKKVIDDYKKFGLDARAIYSWAPKTRTKKPTLKTLKKANGITEFDEDSINEAVPVIPSNINEPIIKEVGGVKLNVVTWRLRPGVLVKIELPEDLTKADVERIKKLLDLEIEVFE
jgi:hypothetical protein